MAFVPQPAGAVQLTRTAEQDGSTEGAACAEGAEQLVTADVAASSMREGDCVSGVG